MFAKFFIDYLIFDDPLVPNLDIKKVLALMFDNDSGKRLSVYSE